MKREEIAPAYQSLALLIIIIIIGVLGFLFIEGYPLLDAFFMTIITVTTVGFGEVHPLSPVGKIFTSFLIISSFGIFAYAASTLARYTVNGVFRNYFKYSKVKKEIDNLVNHVIVVGYGRNGSQAIKELTERKIPLVIIENRETKIKEIQQKNHLLYIEDDPSIDETLIKAGIKKASALISVLPTDEENLFVVLTSHEINPNLTIISRAINYHTIKKLKIAGASHVIMPDKISGQQMARMIAQPSIIEFLDFLLNDTDNGAIMDEIDCGIILKGQSAQLGDFPDFDRKKMNIIGLRHIDGSYIVNPSSEDILSPDDKLIVLGLPSDISLFKEKLLKY